MAFTTDANLLKLFRTGYVQGAFRTGLIPEMAYVGDYEPALWAGTGTPGSALTIVKTKTGTMASNIKSLPFRTDPDVGTYPTEQYPVSIYMMGESIQNDRVAQAFAAIDLFTADMGAFATGAGKTKMVLSRSETVNKALAGATLVDSTAGTDSTRHVLSGSGFTRSFNSSGLLAPVTAANPLKCYLVTASTGALTACSVTGWTPDALALDPNDETGPGTLTFAAPVTTSTRQAIVAASASYRVFAGGSASYSIDDIGSTDYLSLATLRKGKAHLRNLGIRPRKDGLYHLHCSEGAMNGLFLDPEFARALRGTYDAKDIANPYVTGKIEVVNGIALLTNAYAPQPEVECYDAGGAGTGYDPRVDTMAAPTTNATSIPIHTSVLVGEGGLFENYKEPLTEQMNLGGSPNITKMGKWLLVDNFAKAPVERMELVFRAPIDALGRVWTVSYAYTGGFETETDYYADRHGPAILGMTDADGTASRAAYKRRVALIHTAP